ncbi:MAG: hypothetical protein ACFB51_18685 [Anaerolineae bacterium]
MNQRLRAFLLGLLGLLALTILVLLLTGQFNRFVVIPLLTVLWVGLQLVGAVPQPVLWGALVLVGAYAALRAIFSRMDSSRNRSQEESAPAAISGHVARYAHLFEQVDEGLYFERRLTRHLLDTLLAARGYDPNMSEQRILSLIEARKLGLPEELLPAVRASLRPGLTGGQDRARGDIVRIERLIDHLESELGG